MGSLFKFDNLTKDFAAFEANLLNTNAFKFAVNSELRPDLKRYHRLTYCIALFEVKLFSERGDQSHSYLFLTEILSDLLANSTISLIGFYHASQIILRRAIENFYNHVFYSDHPVEFALLNAGRNEYVAMHDLKLYYEAHPKISVLDDERIKQFNDELYKHYHELCRVVHTKGEKYMALAQNLDEIKPDVDISKHFKYLNTALTSLLYLLYKFNREDIGFTHIERNMISTTFAKPIRASLLA